MISMQSRIIFSGWVGNETVGNVKASLMLPYQNSDADSVLIHHQDIALLHEVRRTTAGIVKCSFLHAAGG